MASTSQFKPPTSYDIAIPQAKPISKDLPDQIQDETLPRNSIGEIDSVNDVIKELEKLNFSNTYIEAFKNQNIDGAKLLRLTEKDLSSLGINNPYYRRKIDQLIYEKKSQKKTHECKFDKVCSKCRTSSTSQHFGECQYGLVCSICKCQKIPQMDVETSIMSETKGSVPSNLPTLNRLLPQIKFNNLGQRSGILIAIIQQLLLVHNSGNYHGNIHGDIIIYRHPRWLLLPKQNDDDEDEEYTAPEIQYSSKTDIFQFGFILYEFMVCEIPWQYMPKKLRALEIKRGNRPSFTGTLKNVPFPFMTLINECWHQVPTERPTCSKILSVLQEIALNPLASSIPIASSEPMNVPDSDSDNDESMEGGF